MKTCPSWGKVKKYVEKAMIPAKIMIFHHLKYIVQNCLIAGYMYCYIRRNAFPYKDKF